MTPEGKVKAKVKNWLDKNGIWFYMPVQTGYGVSGIPDFVCCANGKFLAIETKAPGRISNVSDKQALQIAAIGAAGGVAVVVDSVESLVKQLQEMKFADQA